MGLQPISEDSIRQAQSAQESRLTRSGEENSRSANTLPVGNNNSAENNDQINTGRITTNDRQPSNTQLNQLVVNDTNNDVNRIGVNSQKKVNDSLARLDEFLSNNQIQTNSQANSQISSSGRSINPGTLLSILV